MILPLASKSFPLSLTLDIFEDKKYTIIILQLFREKYLVDRDHPLLNSSNQRSSIRILLMTCTMMKYDVFKKKKKENLMDATLVSRYRVLHKRTKLS